MNSKIAAQQLRTWLAGSTEGELLSLLQLHSSHSPLQHSCKEISYKCFQSSIVLNGRRTNGYGRNEKEALSNCLKNILDYSLEDQSFLLTIRAYLRLVEPKAQHTVSVEPRQLDLSTSKELLVQRNKTISQLKVKQKNCTPKGTSKYQSTSPNNLIDVVSQKQNKVRKQGKQCQVKLTQAKVKINFLQNKIRQLEEQNKCLKNQVVLLKQNDRKVTAEFELSQYHSYQPTKIVVSLQGNSKPTHSQQRRQTRSISQTASQSTKKVPTLNLAVLPNYHGKSNKPINSELMQLWEKNHGLVTTVD